MTKRIFSSDEIDMIALIKTIFQNKGIIIITVIISILLAIYIANKKPNPTFTAVTEIKELYEKNTEFDLFNSLNIYKIDSQKFHKVFIENLQKKTIIEKAIKKFNYVDEANFKNKKLYEEEVSKVVNSITLISADELYRKKKGINKTSNFWLISKTTSNKKKWLEILRYLKSQNNMNTIDRVRSEVDSILWVLWNKNDFRKQDINQQLKNESADFDQRIKISENQKKFEIEDINTKIENSVTDYEYQIKVKVAHLKEQAKIARKIGLAKSTNIINGQTIINTGGMAEKSSDYLRGYEAIEEEIKIINSRIDKEIFINNYELKRKKRRIEQSKSLERSIINKNFTVEIKSLNNELRLLDQNINNALRLKSLFDKMPFITERASFQTVIFDINYTIFKKNISGLPLIKMIFLAVTLALILSISYVLVVASFRKKPNN